MLSERQIELFISDGYVKVENAFSKELACECKAVIHDHLDLSNDQSNQWKEPVIRIPELKDKLFLKAANSPILTNIYSQLAGNNWYPLTSMGGFPIRFPSTKKPTDTGWHVDASFSKTNKDEFLDWRINIYSEGKALLMLFLFSDTFENDAPTKIWKGSHQTVAQILYQFEEEGLTFMDLANRFDKPSPDKIDFAIGQAGTVYLCHPFLIHAAQEHKGSSPRFMAQPSLISKRRFIIDDLVKFLCPIEKAIINGIYQR